ncbi:hypothetical protein thsrh120_42570 [Rhizobium sp. No.120]
MAPSEQKAKKKSMFDISLATANFWFDAANIALLIGAIFVGLGTFGVYKMGAIKEKFADERISYNENETAKANENAEIVRKSNLVLQADLERERSARLKLEKNLAPRHLGDEQAKVIADAIKSFRGQSITIISPIGDAEAEAYAAEFILMFKNAGWNPGTADLPDLAVFTPSPTGLVLAINKEDSDARTPPPSAMPLLEVFSSLGLVSSAKAEKIAPKGGILLIVGTKPR